MWLSILFLKSICFSTHGVFSNMFIWLMSVDVQVFKLPTDRIYATYFGGDEKLGLPADNEAKDIWLKYLPPSRVLPFGCKVSSLIIAYHTLRQRRVN